MYQLEQNSVSPSRVVRIGPLGEPIEETQIALAKWTWMVDSSGNTYQGHLQSGRTLSHEPEAERYELIQRKDHVEAGGLFLEQCPHAPRVTYGWSSGSFAAGPSVEPPPGVTACSGHVKPADHPDDVEFLGCDHMAVVVADRRAKSRARWEATQRAATQMTPAAAASLLGQIGQAISLGREVASEATPAAPAPRARAPKVGMPESE
ncbi:MAG: hypothetical protein H0T89_00955 [Deltaproteobacteria bacterium]|nr:hypothetical protein [Deltaproteobacteria bacterium]